MMMQGSTPRYHKIPKIGKLLLGIVLFLGIFVSTFKALYAYNIPFNNTLTTMFSWFNTGYYSNTYFKFGGNNFVGIIFWQTGLTLSTPESININSGAQAIQCTEKLRGIYYNNQRGRTIWPLDTGNLAILSGQGSGYETMTMSKGFFTNCTGVSGGYNPLLTEVYGQIDHTLGSQTFSMFAGVSYNFTGNAISGAVFAHSLTILTGGVHTGDIFDTQGGIAELGMNVPRCQNFTATATGVLPNTNITFTCYGTNSSGYILNVFLSGQSSPLYQTGGSVTTGAIRTYGSGLATGDYLATCTVLGPNSTGPQCGNTIAFHVGGTAATTGCNPNFQGEIAFTGVSGTSMITPSLGTYYTNISGVIIKFSASEPVNFSISGNFINSPLTGLYTGANIFNDIISTSPVYLMNTNGWNYFSSTYTTGSCTYTDSTKRVFLDTIPPTLPSLIAPLSGANVCSSTSLTVTRSGSSDTGAGLSHYEYKVYNNAGATTGIMLSGNVPNTLTSVNLNISSLALGTYYIQISAIDNVGVTSTSSIIKFISSSLNCVTTGRTGVLILTPTIWLRNVNLDVIYRSDPIYILGLTGSTLLSISKGMLFINNSTGLGTTGMVTSNDTIYIDLVSSDKYDTTVSSELHILGLTGTFSLTTKKSNCILSTAEKLVIQNIYQNLKDQYDNDLSKLGDFLHTFQSMVEDEKDLTNSCTLEYLLSLIEDDLGYQGGIDTSNHITPNCKEYGIGYDTTQQAYYAPEMANRFYFINRESLIRHLDYYNPGDCHINTYGSNFWTPNTSDPMKHTAPNGKIYHFIGQYGGFSATEFLSSKYFDSMDAIIRYVDVKNPAKEIWTHTVDTAFNPITYAGPNGKEYKIYKTNKGFMSYKLMKVKYYETITEIKHHIDVNNPSKR